MRALKIGLGLGEPGLYGAYRRFGFGEPTGLPLPGEASGVLRPKARPWFEVETANASFGTPGAVIVRRASSPIRVDARLDEPAWSEAQTIELPYETYPGNNTPAAVRTAWCSARSEL